MYSSKMSWEYILSSSFKYKMAFLEIFKSISVLNRVFWHRFCTFWAYWKAYLTSLTPSTTTPWLGTPPANSRCTKQFLSPPHGL